MRASDFRPSALWSGPLSCLERIAILCITATLGSGPANRRSLPTNVNDSAGRARLRGRALVPAHRSSPSFPASRDIPVGGVHRPWIDHVRDGIPVRSFAGRERDRVATIHILRASAQSSCGYEQIGSRYGPKQRSETSHQSPQLPEQTLNNPLPAASGTEDRGESRCRVQPKYHGPLQSPSPNSGEACSAGPEELELCFIR
jgi:hypothetical protein